MKEIIVNNMVQDIKHNMSTVRHIRILFIMLALFMGTASEAWAYTKLDPVNGVTVYLERTPSNTGGTIAVSDVSAVTGGKKVTLTITPSTGYSISKDLITAVAVKNISSTRTGTPDLMENPLPITDEGDNKYSFVLPAIYTATYVTVTFKQGTIDDNVTLIRSLSEITDPTKKYEMVADIDASGFDGFKDANNNPLPFSGTLDGGFYKIKRLSTPLFTTINGGTVKNITFEDVDVETDGDAGAVACEMIGTSTKIAVVYNCGILSGSVKGGSSSKVGGLIGKLGQEGGTDATNANCYARVINCYSFANIESGYDKGGIVGYNCFSSKSDNIRSMVMNCMFYGDIVSGSNVSPVYGGEEITNVSDNKGLNTYTYYRFDSDYSSKVVGTNYGWINKQNCSLAVEEKYLVRFEFYRQLLNSNRPLAAWYALTDEADGAKRVERGKYKNNEMAKWVLDRTIAPYPILKKQGTYYSVVNYDPNYTFDEEGKQISRNLSTIKRSQGKYLGKSLSITISEPNTQTGGKKKPDNAQITVASLSRPCIDKDTLNYNFNYDKVQLPYYNEVGKGNYTKNTSDGKSRVVTGWMITDVTTSASDETSYTAANYPAAPTTAYNSATYDAPNYNFADRKSSQKDLYTISGRVFSQGAYFDVPYNVTGITIEPYWGDAAYVSDSYLDVTYTANDGENKTYKSKTDAVFQQYAPVAPAKYVTRKINDVEQNVYTSISDALGQLGGTTVYDNAVVLVGNLHQSDTPSTGATAFTLMSADLDFDNEPDYSMIYHHCTRKDVAPIRYDFLNIPGTAMTQKPKGANDMLNMSIYNLKGWFEVTNTCNVSFVQFECYNGASKVLAPVIFQGGMVDQFVSTKTSSPVNTSGNKPYVNYIHVGGNAWFKDFGNGTHSDGSKFTPHIPISVTGGDFENFYLSGTYKPTADVEADNAECYISGGRFGEMAGAAQQQIKGDVNWQIYDADIRDFFGGGINADKPITGDITVYIYNSHVTTFCGGPKFGDMAGVKTENDPSDDKTVRTTAEGCTFGRFFGAGYGGTSYLRKRYYDAASAAIGAQDGNYTGDRGKYYDGLTTDTPNNKDGKRGPGIATDFDYELFTWSDGRVGSRFYVKFASFSLAKTNDVHSKLTNCTVIGSFYGGGHLGEVTGTAYSKLDGCKVYGNVFGGGYSAEVPKVPVRDGGFATAPKYLKDAGVLTKAKFTDTHDYVWTTNALPNNGNLAINPDSPAPTGNVIYTTDGLSTLGQVKETQLTISGNTYVRGMIDGTVPKPEEDPGYRGIDGKTLYGVATGGKLIGGVFGGGDASKVSGSVSVSIINTISTDNGINNVYGGGNTASVLGNDTVQVIGGTMKDVYGGGRGETTVVSGKVIVNIGKRFDNTGELVAEGAPTISHNVYGGSALGKVNGTTVNQTNTTAVTLYKGNVAGSVFGGGLGQRGTNSENPGIAANVYGPVTVTVEGGTAGKVFGCNDQNGAPQSTVAVLITNTAAPTTEIPNPIGSVYGGGNLADYTGSPTVRMDNGTVGYLYGGGLGSSAIITGNTSVTLTNGTVKNDVYGGGNEADVTGSVTVNMTAGTVDKDVYGGGALANTNTNIANDATIKTTVNLLGGTIVGDAYGGGLGRQADNNVTPAVTAVEAKVYGDVKIYLNGMDKSFYDAADATMKTVFDTRITKPEGASYYLVKTTGTKGAVVKRVFGANNKNGSPQKNVTVHVFGTQHKDAEDIRTKLKNANADLEKGSSQTDEEYISVLKGVLTDMITKAGILHIAVTNNEGTGYQDICNNTTSTADALKKAINDINDEINAKILDENTSADDIDALFARIYDVEAVYGGGNEAAYIPTTAYHPTNAPTGSKTQVIIEGCDETSIEAVYGGGNAASAPETNVDIVSAHEIQTVFGGGNGKDNKSDGSANPGADVGVYKVGTTETIYGTGNATTLLEGGYFHEAYGASNSKGNIKGNISINTNPAGSCNLKYDKLVGAGKNADVDKDVIMILGCNPRTKNPLIFGGADNANVNGNVELTITSGTFGKVFGGNNLGGIIKGHIKVNIEETECTPIRIDELYLGGNQAAYSRYGYYKDGDVYKPRTAAMAAITDPDATGYQAAEVGNHTAPYDEPVLNVISCTYIGKVFGGGYGERAVLYGNPTVNINMIAGRWASELGAADKLGEIVDVFGGGNAAKVEGNTTVNIGTTQTVGMVTEPTYLGTSAYTKNTTTGLYDVKVQGANITGNVYGGGNEADITGNTQVNICAKYNSTTAKWESVSYATGLAGVTIGVDGVKDKDHGNVFGGGKGIADNFYCDKAMVGINGAGADEVNYPNGYPDGNTSVFIGNGTVNGSVYGGGEIGRVEMNTAVTIGIEGGTTTSAPRIKGNVFGAGKGLETHGYAALVRGNPIVTIQGNAKVDSCVYGGGEIASVARYQVVGGVPVALAGEEGNYSGYCTVNVLGNAIIGPDEKMVMHHVDAQGNTVNGSDGFPLLPDDAGHVFAAGKGVLPKIYTYADNDHRPKRMLAYNDETISKISSGEIAYWEYSDAPTKKNIWQYFKNETQYFEFIQTLALATQTAVTVDGNAFVKGSVYGGSQNGLVQYDTHVTIDGNCQIGCGKNTTDRHPDAVWGETYPVTEGTNLECASWEYDPLSGAPYDPYAKYLYNGKYYYDEAHTKYAEGGSIVAKDGHTYYGNVFGGGSGSVPYFDTEKGISRYIPTAGEVKRDTYVTISGGHILTNVYGGNEATNVLGTAHVTMTGGTIGVPRTPQQIKDHPVTCYLFGAGKGDQRIFFNKETNVKDAIVSVEGGRIYGSVFGGGEDGHVLRNTSVTIGKADGTGPKIGTVGSTYVDGNVFGGGRGFSGEALTAGNVGGSVDLIINGGTMLGSIYGGGRLASVGYGLYLTTETGYGVMRDDKEYDGSYPNPSPDDAEIFYNKGRGHITVTVNGGTIGKEFESDVEGEHSGNVFGGSMGRLTKLDGSSFDNSHWPLLATAKSTTVNINGGTIKRSVYGGGEMGTVTTDAIVNVSGGTIGTSGKGGAEFGNVYGGGKGYVDPAGSNYVTAGIIKGNTKVTVENGTNTTPTIYHNIYGGGAYGSVGTFEYDENKVITGYTSGGKAEIYVTGGTIGTDGKENGMIFGSSRGDVGAPNSIHDKLAWVYDTHVAIGDTTATATTTETPLIKGSVYGGGENGHNYRNAYVRINGGTIGINNNETITYKDDPKDADKVTYTGKDYNYPYRGNVYGGGCGTDKYYSTGTESHDGNGDTYNSKAGIVQGNAIVHISAGNIVRNVYGAGAMGSVGTMTKDNDNLVISSGGKTTIEISGGTVGVDGTDNGNVFGAARGDETTKQTDVALVKTTDVTVSGDATVVWGNVYGGGEIGCVGTFTERAADGKYIWTSDDQNLNGLTKVSITGGETKGHVFGAGKGSADTFKCEKAMVKKTQVSVSNGKVDKNVYGGGEIGRVEEDTEVKIGVGDGTCTPTISGSVYGAGAGLETHGYSALVRHNTTVTVDGGATIGQSVYGGGEIASVGRYGLDEHKMPEILLDGGYCYVTVKGSATIGSNTVQGNVFGACKGVVPHFDKTNADRSKRSRRMTVYTNATDFPEGAKIDATTGNASSMTSTNTTWEYYDESVTSNLVWEYFQEEDGYNKYLETLALATHPEVTIDGGATVNGSVYGGGEMGLTKGSVMVNILGGTVTEDVYGGGALANTNTTSAVGVLNNVGIPQKESDGKYQTTTVYPKTTVNLLGGSMRDAYGGGLGQLALAAQGTEGQTGYQAAVPAIEAKVFGDVKVNLNGLQAETDMNATILNSLTTGSKLDAVGSGYIVKSSAKGAVVNRVFGCNNLNGTPTKKVQVYVFGTQKSDKAQLNLKAEKNTNTYDVQAVYGGGNLAPYVPADALLDYEQNKATVDAARPEVYIDGCDLTSIKQVYGGGNAASVPATFVEIRRCYEIDEVFGGGNGYDDYSLVEHGETKWYKNPGANVGYYTGYYTNYATYSNYETRTSGDGSGTDSDPYLAVVNPDYDGDEIVVVNGVEINIKARRLAATDIQYGSGIARLEVKGGTIHTSYGGSNSKGNVRAKLSSVYSAMFDDCEMQVAQSYGGGKNAYSDAETDMVADCAKGVKEMFGGAKDADMNGDINMLITNGSSLERVFGGNNTSGAVNGSITITLEEGGCEPIKIGELYAGGFLAPYSVYGYKKTNGVYDTEEVEYIDTDGTTKTRAQRIPLESGTRLYKDPRINVISATSIGNIFGGGYQAKLVGNPHINVNMTTGFVKVTKTLKAGTTDEYIYKDAAGNEYAAEKVSEVSSDPSDSEAKSYIATTDLGTIGNIYGGGNMADIVGDTYVEIGTGKWVKLEKDSDGKVTEVEETLDRNGAKITGNVFGGGKGKADTFLCEKAMIGKDGDGVNNPDGGTHVTIGNGTVDGNVYGGGEIGRVEKNTVVTIGLADAGSDKSKPVIKGSVFGGGKGEEEHGYAALVRGNPTVTIQGKAKIGHNVYGGGEIASVARYKVATTAEEAAAHGVSIDMPYVLQNANSGKCTIIVRDNAEIGPNDMQMTKADGPDDMGHVFGAGKGIMPTIYTYTDDEHKPKRMILNADKTASIWEYFASEEKYIEFIQTLALATETDVTISGEAFVKGSVYGGSENGLVQYDTKVTIEGNCQIGNGEGKTERYTTTQWENENPADFKECAHWEYGLDTNGDGKKDLFAPYDPNANATGELGKYSSGKSTEGGRRVASDGHTFYGNVFGGGSGSVPYFDTTEGISKYLPSAGLVKGNTHVNINGGHILTNVYGGNEATNVLGMAYVTMTGGTIGVPRTAQQIKDHPVTCYLFGAGKGDQRIFFNKETNVNDAIVKVEGGRIYGSVFGGGEDGHVLRNTTVTIGKTDGTGPKIGTVGSTYVDGNVFGGGRGFGGEALTAGNVGGSVDLIINGGTMLGSIYGGGRLASVGYGLYLTTEKGFGTNNDDGYGKMQDDGYSDWTKGEDGQYTRTEISGFKRGYITVTVNGGTIGKEFANDAEGEHSGNVFGGSMGRLTKLDGTPFDTADHWALLATAKSTTVNINGGTIMRSVYGGGEMGTVTTNAIVNVSGGTIGTSGKGGAEFGNVYGGGKGYLDPAQTYVGAGIVKGNTNVTIKNGASGGTTTTPTIYQNVYGGGELGYVGMFTTLDHKEYTWTENTGLCTVGVAGGTITGHVFGAGKGKDDTFECERAMVRTTSVAVSGGKVGGNVYGGGEVGRVDQNSAVTIGSATGDSAPTITGSVFGAGAGVETHGYSALVRGNTAVIVQGNAKVGNSVYGGGQIAAVGRYGLDSSGMPSTLGSGGECVVTVQGNAVIGTNGTGNVFGAGMGVDESKKTYTYEDNANRPKRMMTSASGLYTDDNQALWEYSDDTHTYVWEYFDTREKYLNFLQTLALATDTRLTINGNASVNGSVYGGSESGFVQRYTDVRILGGKIQTIADASGKITEGNVFGGGKGISDNDAAGRVRSDTKVTVLGGTVYGDVYGGGALGKANTLEATNTASVNLLGGVIEGNAFGGGLGNATTAADVGNTRVNLNGMTDEEINGFSDNDFKTLLNTTLSGLKEYSKKGAVVKGSVFGANNVNGTPKGHVLVHVYATQNKDLATIKDKKVITSDEPTASDFDVTGVFGGGKQADYVPELTDVMQSTEVIIEGCDLTSIYEVYGGGYGAATPGTNVLVKGTNIINNVFGGGYGAGNHTDTSAADYNPGANVGFRSDGTTAYRSGGKAVVQLMAGTVNHVYGGSNTLGNIRGGSNVTSVVKGTGDVSPGCCDHLTVQDIFGGGKSAEMFGGTEVVLGCMPDDWIGAIYAGAEAADVHNDVSLTLTSGKFERVFGGNKSSGTIDGYIEVNIEENPECSTPIIIGGLYGGGNEAPYTYPLLDKDPNYLSPRVNVRAFTTIGNIYGGGFGATATVTGNPLVNINVVEGGREYAGEDKPLEDGTTVTLHARSKDAKMGVIGNVFGGGNAAPVIGNTNVMIGTEAEQEMESLKTTDATTGTVTVVKKPVLGADIQGNVYGAGNNAEVTGHTNVVIGKKAK